MGVLVPAALNQWQSAGVEEPLQLVTLVCILLWFGISSLMHDQALGRH